MFTKPKNKLMFEKYHGLGNDFIFLPHTQLKKFKTIAEIKSFVIQICNRHYAVGADGVVFLRFLKTSKKCEVLIVNSDGSFAATCGNALRCLGLKLFRDKTWNGKKPVPVFRLNIGSKDCTGLQQDEAFSLETKKEFATIVKIENKNNKKTSNLSAIVSVVFDLPKNIYRWDFKNVLSSSDCISLESSPAFSKIAADMNAIFVQLENPHLVFFSPKFQDFSDEEYIQFGKEIQKFTNVNVGMLTINSVHDAERHTSDEQKSCKFISDGYKLKVFERGAGLTLACGSGAVASALALRFHGHIPHEQNAVMLKMLGGTVKVTLPKILDPTATLSDRISILADQKIILSADATFVFLIISPTDPKDASTAVAS